MATTYTLISSVTVGSGGTTNEVTFSSIPQTYTDLLINISSKSSRSDNPGNWGLMKFNTSSANFSNKPLWGDGSGVTSTSITSNIGYLDNGNTANETNVFSNCQLYIPNYTGSNNKSYSIDAVSENNATLAYTYLVAGLWSQTAAITSITFYPDTFTPYRQYSTFYLYGISNA
jgi:hypothetical protein